MTLKSFSATSTHVINIRFIQIPSPGTEISRHADCVNGRKDGRTDGGTMRKHNALRLLAEA